MEQGGASLHQFGYVRDGNKNIIGRTQNGTTDQFGYDPSNRLASEAAGEKNKTYCYNTNEKRSVEGSGKVFGMKNAEYTYDYCQPYDKGEHPFWLDGKGWTFVKDLKVGDLLVSSPGGMTQKNLNHHHHRRIFP